MRKVVLASRNKHKAEEISKILKDLKVKVLTLDNFPKAPKVREDGKTLEENAIKKAVKIARFTNSLVIADDSGLEVKALDGKPGIFSARFAGYGCSYHDNNRKLLRLMKDVPKNRRRAKFRCVIAVADEKEVVGTAEGTIAGFIGLESKGRYGFGYDPVFVIPKYKKTFAQIGPRIKNKISHRAKALHKAHDIIQRYFRSHHSVLT